MSLPYYDTHICIVSKELAPNFLPVRLKSARPKKIVLLVSDSMKERAEIFENILKKHAIKTDMIFIQNASVKVIQEELNMYLEQLGEKESVALNMTGGTKPMSFAALEVARMHEKPCFYVDTDNRQILFFEESNIIEDPISDVLKYQDLLDLNGYSIQKEDKAPITKKNREFTDLLIKNAGHWEKVVGQLNYYAQNVEKTLFIQREKTEAKNFTEFLEECQNVNLLSYTEENIRFNDEKARVFCNGGWLEEYVYSRVYKLYSDHKITSCGYNVKIHKANKKSTAKVADNELDTVFTAKNKLFVIEAKSKRITEKNKNKSDNENDNKRSDDIVYKLDALKDRTGGIFSTAIFVSYRKLTETDEKRAKAYNIQVIANTDIKNLSQKLENLIR